MSGLRLDLIVRTYPVDWDPTGEVTGHRWSWRLWSGSRIVSTSGSQLYSRRIDCVRGAEVGTGVRRVLLSIRHGLQAHRLDAHHVLQPVTVRIVDERTTP